MNPIWKNTPGRATAAFMRSVSARVRAGGFSQKVGLPLAAAATVRSAWVWVGLAMTTASTSESLKSVPGSACGRAS